MDLDWSEDRIEPGTLSLSRIHRSAALHRTGTTPSANPKRCPPGMVGVSLSSTTTRRAIAPALALETCQVASSRCRSARHPNRSRQPNRAPARLRRTFSRASSTLADRSPPEHHRSGRLGATRRDGSARKASSVHGRDRVPAVSRPSPNPPLRGDPCRSTQTLTSILAGDPNQLRPRPTTSNSRQARRFPSSR